MAACDRLLAAKITKAENGFSLVGRILAGNTYNNAGLQLFWALKYIISKTSSPSKDSSTANSTGEDVT